MKKRSIALLLALVMLTSVLTPEAMAVKPAEAAFDVHSVTSVSPAWPEEGSLRLSKSLEWIDKKNGLAKIALTVEGVPVMEPVPAAANIVFLVDTSQGMYKPDGYCSEDVYDPEKGEYYCSITKEHYPVTGAQYPETPGVVREHRSEIAQVLNKSGTATGGRMALVQSGMKELFAKLSSTPDTNVSIVSYGTRGNTVLDWTESRNLAKINLGVDDLQHEALPKNDGSDIIYRVGSMCQKCGHECEGCTCINEKGCTKEGCAAAGASACVASPRCPLCGDYCSNITKDDSGNIVNGCSCSLATPETTCEGCHQNMAVPCSGVQSTRCDRCHHICQNTAACTCGPNGTQPCVYCVDIALCTRCGHHCAKGENCACDADGNGACSSCLIELVCVRCQHHCKSGSAGCTCGVDGKADCAACVKETRCANCDHLCLKGAECECLIGVKGSCVYCIPPDICAKCDSLCRRGTACKCVDGVPCADCYKSADCDRCGHLCLNVANCKCGEDGTGNCDFCFSVAKCKVCHHLCERSESCQCGRDGEAPCKFCYTEAKCAKCGKLCKKGEDCMCVGGTTACKFCYVKADCIKCSHLCEKGIECDCALVPEDPDCAYCEQPAVTAAENKAAVVKNSAPEETEIAAVAVPLAAAASSGNTLKPLPPGLLPFLPGSNIRNYSAGLFAAQKQVEKVKDNGKPTIVIMLANDPANVGLADGAFGKRQAIAIKDLGAELYGVAVCGDVFDVKSGITVGALKPLVSPDAADGIKHTQIADLTDVNYQSGADNADRLSVAQALERICAPYMDVKPAATNLVLKDTINSEYFSVYYTTKTVIDSSGNEERVSVPMVSDGVEIEGNTATIAIDKTTGKAQEFFIWIQVNGGVLQFNNQPSNAGNAELTYTDSAGKPEAIEVESPTASWTREYTIRYILAAVKDPSVTIPDQLMSPGSTVLLNNGVDSMNRPIKDPTGRSLKSWIDLNGVRFPLGSEFTAEKAAIMGCNQTIELRPRFNAIFSFSVEGGRFSRGGVIIGPYYEGSETKEGNVVKIPFPTGTATDSIPTTVAPFKTGATGTWYERKPDGDVLLTSTDNVPVVDGAHYVLKYDSVPAQATVTLDAATHGTVGGKATQAYTNYSGTLLKHFLGTIGHPATSVPAVVAHEGWNMTGWKKPAGNEVMTADDLAKAVDADITYTAQYSALVTFDPKGGTFADTTTSSKRTWVPEGTVTASEGISKPTYTFEGWYEKDASTAFDFTKPITKPTHLIARYNEVIVTLDAAEHGTLGGKKTKEYAGAVGSELRIILGTSSIPDVKEAAGWKLAGWKNPTGVMMTADDLALAVNANITYTAQYDAGVTFDPNGGAFADHTTGNKIDWLKVGTTATSKSAEKSGYQFDGWYLGETKFNFDTAITEPITLIARYRENSSSPTDPPKPKQVTVTLDAATHGTIGGEKTKRYEGTRGDTLGSILGVSTVPGVSAASGWRLAGWQGQGGTMSDGSLSAAVESNQTYTAKYDAQVVFDPNGGSFISDGAKTSKTEWVSEGGTLSDSKPATKENATFEGWYEGDVKIDLTKPITRPMHLVARYSGAGLAVEKSYEVTRIGTTHGSIRVGDTIKYTILVRNAGETTLEKVKLTDTMFAKADGGKVELDGKSVTVTGNTLEIPRLNTKQSVKITYGYTVKSGDANRAIENVATASHDDLTDTADVTTSRVEGMQDIKLYYAAEQLNAAGTGISTPAKLAEPLVVLSKYPGERITKTELEQAIADKALPSLAREGVTIDEGHSRIFYQAGSKSTNWDTSSTEIAASYVVKESDNRFYVGYPLQRLTMTYQPGTGGTTVPQAQTKGVAQGGKVVFTIPYGATPGIWFGTGTANGALAVTCTGKSGNQFNGWQPEPALDQPLTSNQSYTAQWRSAGFAVEVEIYADGKLVDTRSDLRLTDVTSTSAKLPLDAAQLLAEEQSLGQISQGYRFASYTKGGQKVTSANHTFDVRSGDVVRVDYVPYGLAVWHVSGKRSVFDADQSVAVLTSNTRVQTNRALVNNASYSSTAVTVSGKNVPGYGETVNALSDRGPWEVVFRYLSTGKDGEDELIDILDPEVPLGPGLDMTDHFAYVIGYPDGNVKPEGYIARSEIAAVFFRLLNAESRERLRTDANPFTDMTASHWASTEVATLNNGNILQGYADGGFHPDSYITRGEMAAIAARFESGSYDGENLFPDIDGHWAAEYINRASRYGWVRGMEDGSFHPDDYITRAEAMTLINNVLYRQTQPEGMLPNMIVWPDNTTDKWYYTAVQEATNSHNFEREMPFDFETWTALSPTPVW